MSHSYVSFGILKFWNPRFKKGLFEFPFIKYILVSCYMKVYILFPSILKISELLLSSSYKSLHEHFQGQFTITSLIFRTLSLFFFFFGMLNFFFFLISWRLITLQYCSGFCHTLT